MSETKTIQILVAMILRELNLLYFVVMQRRDVVLLYSLSYLIQDTTWRASIFIESDNYEMNCKQSISLYCVVMHELDVLPQHFRSCYT